MVHSQKKGASGERDFSQRLEEYIGFRLERNLEQTRAGGHDLVGLPSLAIEIKNCKTLSLPAWWRQATTQAEATGQIPVLGYKIYRKGWRVRVPAHCLALDLAASYELGDTVDMSLPLFGELCKKLWVEQPREVAA